jgi:hypothetical protein
VYGSIKTTLFNLNTDKKMTVVEKVAENGKNKNIKGVTGFSKSMPQGFDTDSILGVGDIVEIPTAMPQVYQQKFGEDADGNPVYGEFIVVNVKHEGKADRAINFFPSSLTKNIWPSQKNDDGEIELVDGRPMQPKGTAVDLYTSVQGTVGAAGETDMQLGVNKLLGKNIHVADAVEVDVQVFRNGKRTNALKKSKVFTYNLA